MCFWLKFSKHKKTMESSRLGFLDQWFLNCLVATKFSCPKNWTESRKERETESGKMGEGIQRQRFLVGVWKQVEKQERRKRRQRSMSVLAMIHTCSEQTSSLTTGRCFKTIFGAKGYPCRTWGGLSQAGVQFCWLHHMLLMAKGKGPGMPIFEPSPSSWLLRENCQWGVPGHKKWSTSWGLEYFTWKTQAFSTSICQWDRTYCSPEWGWVCLTPGTLRFSSWASLQSLTFPTAHTPSSPYPWSLRAPARAHNSKRVALRDKYFSTYFPTYFQWTNKPNSWCLHSTYLPRELRAISSDRL